MELHALRQQRDGEGQIDEADHAGSRRRSRVGLREATLARLSRDSYRHPPQADAMTRELSSKIVEIAHARRRFGYRRIHDLLCPSFPGVNHKRVYRLYSAARPGDASNA